MTTSPRRRVTKQQVAITEAMDELNDFVSAQELHAKMRDKGESIGLATVYRGLQTLASDGQVDVLRTKDGEAVYRRCATSHHHHHLVCRVCGRAVEVEGAAVEKWADQMSRQHGFTEVEHTLEIFGVCSDCAGVGPH